MSFYSITELWTLLFTHPKIIIGLTSNIISIYCTQVKMNSNTCCLRFSFILKAKKKQNWHDTIHPSVSEIISCSLYSLLSKAQLPNNTHPVTTPPLLQQMVSIFYINFISVPLYNVEKFKGGEYLCTALYLNTYHHIFSP